MKKILKTLGLMSLIPIVLLSDFDPRAIFCSPDRGAVKVMKPIAKIIANDIVKNGIPRSLKDIKGLPYVLEGCERSEVYWDKLNPYKMAKNIRDSDLLEIKEKCFFIKNKKTYNINIRFTYYLESKNTDFGKLRLYNLKTYTGISYNFKKNKNVNHIFITDEIHIYNNKTSGICTQFRQ